nr:MAG TPA: hypothetical protein [Caudoviricetes sp.]
MLRKIIKALTLKKRMRIEVIETLCTICLYLESEGRYRHNHYAVHMRSHFDELKHISCDLRGEK